MRRGDVSAIRSITSFLRSLLVTRQVSAWPENGPGNSSPSISTLLHVSYQNIGPGNNDEIHDSPDSHRSEEHTSELQSRVDLVCRLLLEKKKKTKNEHIMEVTNT